MKMIARFFQGLRGKMSEELHNFSDRWRYDMMGKGIDRSYILKLYVPFPVVMALVVILVQAVDGRRITLPWIFWLFLGIAGFLLILSAIWRRREAEFRTIFGFDPPAFMDDLGVATKKVLVFLWEYNWNKYRSRATYYYTYIPEENREFQRIAKKFRISLSDDNLFI